MSIFYITQLYHNSILFVIMELVDVYGIFLIVFLFTGVTTFYRNYFFQVFVVYLFGTDNSTNKEAVLLRKNYVKNLFPTSSTLNLLKKTLNPSFIRFYNKFY